MHRLVSAVFLVVLTASVFFVAGCATTPPPAVVVPTPPPPEALPAADLSPVAGHPIVLDPGHGGQWPGAVASSNTLKESDVNLRVALALRDVLQTAGAQVWLTREADTALADSLSQDLAARAQFAADQGAEIFVSIHHNADIDVSGRNDLEVYYRISDDWASLDLAQSLTYELARRLRADAAAKKLLAGNYKVLRLATMPAVLLESSYMTSAENAAFLATEEGVRREAAAIAAGIAHYFSLNPPRVTRAGLIPGSDETVYSARLEISPDQTIEPSSVTVMRDEIPVEGLAQAVSGGVLWTFTDALPNGEYELVFRGRNVAGAGFQHVLHAQVDRPARRVTARQRPERAPQGWEGEACLEVRVLDALEQPVGDGTEVLLLSDAAQQTAQTREGMARFYFFPHADTGPFTCVADDVRVAVAPAMGGEGAVSLRVVEPAGKGVGGAVIENEGSVLAVSTPEGWAAFSSPARGVTIRSQGYDVATATLDQPHTSVTMRAIAGGVLQGARIVLDPWFGGYQPGAVGPYGERASDAAMDVARRLAGLLEQAGADVELTRTRDVNPSDLERLFRAEAASPDLVIAITFGASGGASRLLSDSGTRAVDQEAFVGHYPGSPNGERLAHALAGELGIGQVAPSVAFIIQQTSAPAVIVQPADIGRGGAASALQETGVRRRIAEAMYAALVEYFEQE
jgi:N-acetylmuramoyl-L-alanine amidase